MNIRIDQIQLGQATIVHIAGRLSGPAVAQLTKVCDPIESLFVIDLSSLSFADEDGIDTLQALIDRGATVRGASPFIEMLLEMADGEIGEVGNHSKFIWF